MAGTDCMLPNVYGRGALFAFSALDGETSYDFDMVATLTEKPIGFRIETKSAQVFSLDVAEHLDFRLVTGDSIEAVSGAGDIFVAFLDRNTIVGYAPVCPTLTRETTINQDENIRLPDLQVRMAVRMDGDRFVFAVCAHSDGDTAADKAAESLHCDYSRLKDERYAFYRSVPAVRCSDPDINRLYYKAWSVNKLNIQSAQGAIPVRWTTPDRIPHRDMFLWDSGFHALSLALYDTRLAEDALRAVLSQQREDGMIPIRMTPHRTENLTQPPVLAWSVWECYERSGNRSFLSQTYTRLSDYILWSFRNRDKDADGLLEWQISEQVNCRSGESGMDNSPRFDNALRMAAVDYACYLVNEADCLARMATVLGFAADVKAWNDKKASLTDKINELLWCEEDGLYYDRNEDGSFNKVPAVTSFLPLFARVCNETQAKRLVKHIRDKNSFFTEMPLPSVSRQYPKYSTDMWRGAVWLNMNYMVIRGLVNYGFTDLAGTLRNKTLESVGAWYKKTGCIFEFYDADNRLSPTALWRKGPPTAVPDWRNKVHSIADYNWSASFVIRMLVDTYGINDETETG